MPEEYHREPALGLASGVDGLDITRQILRGAAEHLEEGGLLVVEVGNSWVALDEAYPQIASRGWSSSAAGTVCSV